MRKVETEAEAKAAIEAALAEVVAKFKAVVAAEAIAEAAIKAAVVEAAKEKSHTFEVNSRTGDLVIVDRKGQEFLKDPFKEAEPHSVELKLTLATGVQFTVGEFGVYLTIKDAYQAIQHQISWFKEFNSSKSLDGAHVEVSFNKVEVAEKQAESGYVSAETGLFKPVEQDPTEGKSNGVRITSV